ncbi:2-dehydro-3-deoxyphosphogluconate aldolase/(4S)-4-hydroxy-2-oxoglutarate aldolase [Rivibacter subsaxonicus]|uniref:2-dehydro-3-deoxy-phosphogluconate aldolase n=2 Tax=Rivibacter subsaxonicus TaxID=457575 RepID=A0A4V2FRV4_9BURK|nr:2-dehydro-3-deoxyphosphogluconate aldolase/(4S)-4-hydroxy-2-oxoglutarate aldolase [Rivibacter subsaxonicus]
MSAMNIRDLMHASPVMPVIVLDRVADAVPLARALVAGGIRVLEVTLRTAAALESVRAIRAEVPQALVGVGTVTTPAELDAAQAAGAVFGVSPGASPALLRAIAASGLPFLPGVMTPSDVIAAREAGFEALKLFPAAQAGGIGMLKALAGPFPGLVFCPTGGIDAGSAPDFLALPNVLCVGGSWLAPKALVEAGDWAGIERIARAAAALRPAA